MVVSHLIHISGFGKLPEPPFFHCLNGVQHSCRDRLPPEFVRDRRMKKRPVPEGFSGRGIRPVCCVLRRAGRACGSAWGTFGRVLKNVRLSAAAARRLRCRRLRCRRLRLRRRRSSHRRSPSLAALLYVGFRGGRQQVAAFAAGHEKIPETSTRSPGYVFRVAPD